MATKNVSFYGASQPLLGGKIQREYAPARNMAQSLMQAGGSMAPVQSWQEGMARALQGGIGGYLNYATMKAQGEREQARNEDINQVIAGGNAKQWVNPDTGNTTIQQDGIAAGPGDVPTMVQTDKNVGGYAGMQAALANIDNPDIASFRQNVAMGEMQERRALEAAELARARAIAARDEKRLYDEGQDKIKFGRSKELKLDERKLKIGDNYDKIALQAYFREKQAHDKAFLDVNQIPPPFRPFAPSSASSGQTTLPAQPVIAQPQTINSQTAAPNAPPMSLADAQSLKVLQTAASKKQGENLADAQNELPMIENNSKYLIKALDAVLAPQMDASGKPVIKNNAFVPGIEHPGLESSVGIKGYGAILDNLPYSVGGPIQGTSAADFTAALKQVTGKQFLQAFETLKGGGQITEIEGTKATEALANLSTSQSEKQFRKALLAFRYEVGELVKIAKKRASTNSLPPPPLGYN